MAGRSWSGWDARCAGPGEGVVPPHSTRLDGRKRRRRGGRGRGRGQGSRCRERDERRSGARVGHGQRRPRVLLAGHGYLLSRGPPVAMAGRAALATGPGRRCCGGHAAACMHRPQGDGPLVPDPRPRSLDQCRRMPLHTRHGARLTRLARPQPCVALSDASAASTRRAAPHGAIHIGPYPAPSLRRVSHSLVTHVPTVP